MSLESIGYDPENPQIKEARELLNATNNRIFAESNGINTKEAKQQYFNAIHAYNKALSDILNKSF